MSIPKCLTAALVTALGVAAAISCGRKGEEEPMTPAARPSDRVGARLAAATITNERCKAAERCGEVGQEGSRYVSLSHCEYVLQDETYESLAQEPLCRSGVLDSDLRRCRIEIASEDCGGFAAAVDSVDRYMSCRAAHLCMD